MSDLIDRQSVIDAIEPWLNGYGYSEGERNMLKCCIQAIKDMPSAEPEIIHCKDCEHYCEPEDEFDAWCSGWGGTTTEDGFCNWAE